MTRPSPPVVGNDPDPKNSTRVASGGARMSTAVIPPKNEIGVERRTHGYATRAASGGNVRWEG
jgi:hypothetical protein